MYYHINSKIFFNKQEFENTSITVKIYEKNAIWLDLKVSIKKLFTIVLQRILRYGILIKYTRYRKHSVYFQKIGKMIELSGHARSSLILLNINLINHKK